MIISWILLIGWTYSWNQGNWPEIAEQDKKHDLFFSIFWSLFASITWPVFIAFIYFSTEHLKYGWFSRDIKLRKIKNEKKVTAN
jgi:heme/copper-type cytochrome/quinol oxidase subunit 2